MVLHGRRDTIVKCLLSESGAGRYDRENKSLGCPGGKDDGIGEMFTGGDGRGGDAADGLGEKKVVYAVVEHQKVHVPTRAEHLEVRIKWDDDIEAIAREEASKGLEKAKI